MHWLIIAWKQDPAAMGIYRELELMLDVEAEMEIISENPMYLEPGSYSDVDRLIVLSKHFSSKGIPALTVHSTGNWTSDNSLGGAKRELSYSDPVLNSELIRKIDELASLEGLKSRYDVVLEVTHHGPTLEVPVTFVEVGSTSTEWNDPEAHRVLAKAVNEILKSYDSSLLESRGGYLGIGGPHYARVFTKYVIEKGYNVGHIMPKYAMNAMEPEEFEVMVHKGLQRTLGAKEILVEWKGIPARFKDVLRERFSEQMVKIK
jgi:D-aminoacyl-tRNA deacylase